MTPNKLKPPFETLQASFAAPTGSAAREHAMQWCLAEVLQWHSDPDSPEYNECDKEPCHWCSVALQLASAAERERSAMTPPQDIQL